MSTADQDVVELLRQRVRQAWGEDTVHRPHKMRPHPIAEALSDLGDALADDDETATDPAVQAVARALLGEARVDGTEWAAFWGAEDPSAVDWSQIPLGPAGFVLCASRAEAEEIATAQGGRVASLTVLRTPWQVVDTEGGEPRG